MSEIEIDSYDGLVDVTFSKIPRSVELTAHLVAYQDVTQDGIGLLKSWNGWITGLARMLIPNVIASVADPIEIRIHSGHFGKAFISNIKVDERIVETSVANEKWKRFAIGNPTVCKITITGEGKAPFVIDHGE